MLQIVVFSCFSLTIYFITANVSKNFESNRIFLIKRTTQKLYLSKSDNHDYRIIILIQSLRNSLQRTFQLSFFQCFFQSERLQRLIDTIFLAITSYRVTPFFRWKVFVSKCGAEYLSCLPIINQRLTLIILYNHICHIQRRNLAFQEIIT